MKKLLYLFLITVICNLSVGKTFSMTYESESNQKRTISIRAKAKSLKSSRSIMPDLEIFGQIEKNHLTISFSPFIPDQELTISITDEFGNVIFDNLVMVINNQLELYLAIDDEEETNYNIEIDSSQFYGCGSF